MKKILIVEGTERDIWEWETLNRSFNLEFTELNLPSEEERPDIYDFQAARDMVSSISKCVTPDAGLEADVADAYAMLDHWITDIEQILNQLKGGEE